MMNQNSENLNINHEETLDVGPEPERISQELFNIPIEEVNARGKSAEFIMQVKKRLSDEEDSLLRADVERLTQEGLLKIPDVVIDIDAIPEDLRDYVVTEVDPTKESLSDYVSELRKRENLDKEVEIEMAEKYESIMRLITEGSLSEVDSKTALHLIKKMVYGKTPEDLAKARWDFGIPQLERYKDVVIDIPSIGAPVYTENHIFDQLEMGNYRNSDLFVKEGKLLGVPSESIVPITERLFERVEDYIKSREARNPDYESAHEVTKDLEFCALVRNMIMDIHPFFDCNSRITTFYMAYLQKRLFKDESQVRLLQQNAMQFMLPSSNIDYFNKPEEEAVIKNIYGEDAKDYTSFLQTYRTRVAVNTREDLVRQFIEFVGDDEYKDFKEKRTEEISENSQALLNRNAEDIATSNFISRRHEDFEKFYIEIIDDAIKAEPPIIPHTRRFSAFRTDLSSEKERNPLTFKYEGAATYYARELMNKEYRFGQVELVKNMKPVS